MTKNNKKKQKIKRMITYAFKGDGSKKATYFCIKKRRKVPDELKGQGSAFFAKKIVRGFLHIKKGEKGKVKSCALCAEGEKR